MFTPFYEHFDLPIEMQKRLTKFLNECWHEMRGGSCQKCGVSNNRELLETDGRLKFQDWRVIGLLIDKVGGTIFVGRLIERYGYSAESSDQRAICFAVNEWLKNKEL